MWRNWTRSLLPSGGVWFHYDRASRRGSVKGIRGETLSSTNTPSTIHHTTACNYTLGIHSSLTSERDLRGWKIARFLDPQFPPSVHTHRKEQLVGHSVPQHWTQQGLDDLGCVERRFGIRRE